MQPQIVQERARLEKTVAGGQLDAQPFRQPHAILQTCSTSNCNITHKKVSLA
jgi:hypothetical protein